MKHNAQKWCACVFKLLLVAGCPVYPGCHRCQPPHFDTNRQGQRIDSARPADDLLGNERTSMAVDDQQRSGDAVNRPLPTPKRRERPIDRPRDTPR